MLRLCPDHGASRQWSLFRLIPSRKKVVTMTKDALTRESITAYGVPVALLLAAVLTALFLPNMYQIAVAVIALGVGFAIRPRSVGIVWSVLYALLLLAAIAALAFGRELPKMPDENQGLAPAELFFTALLLFVYLAAVVLPPLWLGRWLGNERVQHRHHGASPA
jgi:hypothetical protein